MSNCIDGLQPDLQVIDHSIAGPTKKKAGSLCIKNMNLCHDGKQSHLRDTVITADTVGRVGEYYTTNKDRTIKFHRGLRPDDI